MVLAIIIELVSFVPAGSPAGCHVMSQKRGWPTAIRSKLEERRCPRWKVVRQQEIAYQPIRFAAPLGVRGGKNSSEYQRSLLAMRFWIFSVKLTYFTGWRQQPLAPLRALSLSIRFSPGDVGPVSGSISLAYILCWSRSLWLSPFVSVMRIGTP